MSSPRQPAPDYARWRKDFETYYAWADRYCVECGGELGPSNHDLDSQAGPARTYR
jgi:hypothetical protein